MVYSEKEARKAHNEAMRRYYLKTIKPKLNRSKWTISKKPWVKCPFCGSNSQWKPLTPHEPEVFSMLYGGRGCLRKYPEEQMREDTPQVWEQIKKEYLFDLVAMCSRFLYCHLTKEQMIAVMNDMGISLSVQIKNPLARPTAYTEESAYEKESALTLISKVRVTPVMEATTQWENTTV